MRIYNIGFIKWFAAALLLCLGAQTAIASPSPEQMLQATTDQMRGLIKQNHDTWRGNAQAFYKAVDEVLVPHFDVKYIAQLILARNWKSATDAQREQFQAAFKDMLVHAYADALLDYYDSAKIDIKPARIENGNDATVDSNVAASSSAQPVAISFKLRKVGDNWLIYDLIVENVSLVLNFRTQVGAEIKRTSLDAVIARMQQGQFIKPDGDDDHAAHTGNGQAG